jgi:VPDSG-CTERM motif
MKTNNIVPSKKVALLALGFCAVMLAFAQNASATPHPLPPNLALALNDTHVVGTVTPDSPADPSNEATFINYMISLATGGSGHVIINPGNHDNFITRSANLFANLPNATATGAVRTDTPPGTNVVDLGPTVGVYSYLLAKYDGKNDSSVVWYVGDLSGNLTIPLFGPGGKGLSHWTLFGPGVGVPDGGTTVMLLGAALGALGIVRRYLTS